MGSYVTPLPILKDQQSYASHPRADVWLSASAGTGKTEVLSARVLRLLLSGAQPESILCLTFTKAGAAEMAERIHQRLGAWVRMSAKDLSKDLFALGEANGAAEIEQARQLFAKVLDARGGGLRIQTIHSFCQTLLGGFPAEAGLTPGFRPLEAREEAVLGHRVLADMVGRAEAGGEIGFIERLQTLALQLGEDRTKAFLSRCAAVPETMDLLGPATAIEARLYRALCDGLTEPWAALEAKCADAIVDLLPLDFMRVSNLEWKTQKGTINKQGEKSAKLISEWLEADDPKKRVERLESLSRAWTKADGEFFAKNPDDPEYCDARDFVAAWAEGLLELKRGALLAENMASALVFGQRYARDYADAKRAGGLVDFNDLIRATVKLLGEEGMGDWIRYKLDQGTDHILVDEAQDTNSDQWAIVESLAEEFYAGEGAKGDAVRTIFTVGDYKQAIFGFQGTDPLEFNKAKRRFQGRAQAAGREILDLSLSMSFRSSQPILDVVDAVIDEVGSSQFGLDRPDPRHVSAKEGGAGQVTLWPAFTGVMSSDDDEDDVEIDDEMDWVSDAERLFAGDIAEKVRDWTTGGLWLENEGRAVTAGDIMILVRSRGELARLLVARLYEAGVDVAGVDRLRLNAPIVVQDMLACVRFALQPEDDLNLAALLVSPIIGWSQDELYDRAKGRKRIPLWQHLGVHKPTALREILAMADMTTPYRFLEQILSGPIAARRKITVRLGDEARDPINELLSAALQFESDATASLQLFLDWFDRGDVDIKRDASGPGNAVRVMTVHGAKGLQAPVVVLADATSDPESKRLTDLKWEAEEGLILPIYKPRAEEMVKTLEETAEQAKRREREEHWRLLYVAMTRAKEYLFVGGAMKRQQQKNGELGEDCWHTRVGAALMAMGVETDQQGARTYKVARTSKKATDSPRDAATAQISTMPAWLDQPAPEDARPPKPLAPSALRVADTVASPPPNEKLRAAAERGKNLHSLFERLPAVPPKDRAAAADKWLHASAGVTDDDVRAEIVTAALRTIDDPRFAAIFSADALAEAPLAGVVDGQVIAGVVDRLLISDSEILVVDFKTGRHVPTSDEAVPSYHLAQMGAYVAVLAGIFPDRAVKAALLYTSGPKLVALSEAVLATHKPSFRAPQEELTPGG